MSLDANDKKYIANEIAETKQELKADIAGVKSDVSRLEVLMEDQGATLSTILELLQSQLGINSTLEDHTHRLLKLEISDKSLVKTVGLHSRQLGRLTKSNGTTN